MSLWQFPILSNIAQGANLLASLGSRDPRLPTFDNRAVFLRKAIYPSLFVIQYGMAQFLNHHDQELQRSFALDLFSAIENGNGPAVLRAASKISDLDAHSNEWDETPLIFACRRDLQPEEVAYLLSRSNALRQSAQGFTALILAAWGRLSHSSDLVRLLLPASNPLALTIRNNSALRHAIASAHSPSVELLLPVSDLTQLDSSGRAPIAQAKALMDIESRDSIVGLILAETARREALLIAAGIFIPTRTPRADRPLLRL